jgi:hypothetical protein
MHTTAQTGTRRGNFTRGPSHTSGMRAATRRPFGLRLSRLASRYAVKFIWSKDRFALSRPILYHTNQVELVYDAFLGSGTTLVPAEFTERACLGLLGMR